MPDRGAFVTPLGNPTGLARSVAARLIRDLHQEQRILLATSDDLLDHDQSVEVLALALSRVMPK